MRNDRSETHRRFAEETARVEAAVRCAVRKALRDHKRTGDPIVVFEDGEIRWIPASEIRLPG
jgi:hypothetical protein